jgi:hypothetical protein
MSITGGALLDDLHRVRQLLVSWAAETDVQPAGV